MRRATAALLGDCHVGQISIHALHEESDPNRIQLCHLIIISIHALHEESDRGVGVHIVACLDISIHALHEESDFHVSVTQLDIVLFQSTLSMRRATQLAQATAQGDYISIHALHEESDRRVRGAMLGFMGISIHALHEESDQNHHDKNADLEYFNPRSP